MFTTMSLDEEDMFASVVNRLIHAETGREYAECFALEGVQTFGNNASVRGRNSIQEAAETFFAATRGMNIEHHVIKTWWFGGYVGALMMDVSYTRKEDDQRVILPCLEAIRICPDTWLVLDLKTYMDISPAFDSNALGQHDVKTTPMKAYVTSHDDRTLIEVGKNFLQAIGRGDANTIRFFSEQPSVAMRVHVDAPCTGRDAVQQCIQRFTCCLPSGIVKRGIDLDDVFVKSGCVIACGSINYDHVDKKSTSLPACHFLHFDNQLQIAEYRLYMDFSANARLMLQGQPPDEG